MPEPIVIEIPDGKTVEARSPEFEVRNGIAMGGFRVVPVVTPGRVRLETLGGVFLAWLNIAPDPVRAAVLAALEQAKVRVRAELRSLDQGVFATSLCAAIDAPDETVSEGEAMRAACQAKLLDLANCVTGHGGDERRGAYRNGAHCLNTVEPAR